MFNILLRRLQKQLFWIKLAILVLSGWGLYFLVIDTAPELLNLVVFSLDLLIFISVVLSLFLSTKLSVLVGVTIPFLLFLKAVDLLSPINLGLFALFVLLLTFYLYKK